MALACGELDDEKLHGTTKVGYIFRVGQLREVLVHNLHLGSLVLALEHILKLHEGVREVKIDLLGPFF